LSEFGSSWNKASRDPSFYADTLLGVAGGSLAREAMIANRASQASKAFVVAEGAGVDAQVVLPDGPVLNEASTLSMETGPHRTMKLRSDIPGQSHHLNQNAAYRGVIPREEGAAVKLEGNALSEPGSPHYEAHASLEDFWAPYRQTNTAPTNLDYSLALKRSLEAAGYSSEQATQLTREAIRNRLDYGALGGEDVPRVPNRTSQRKRENEP
jgi:hypothetical protein